MGRLSTMTWVGSLALHALVFSPLVVWTARTAPSQVYDDGAGQDAYKLDQGITIETISFGDAVERVELAEAAPLVANPTPPPPVVETKPVEPELKDVITATQSTAETIKATDEPPPLVPVKPQEVALADQAAQPEVYLEKSSGAAQDGGRASELSAYAKQINGALSRVSVNAAGVSGRVEVELQLSPGGKVLGVKIEKSSGVPAADKLALEMVAKATFPPLPDALSNQEFFSVPIGFNRKKR
jgi:TonB family protein